MSNLIKYPRTPHLPWSPGMSDDDRMIRSLDFFIGKKVVVTEKLDGENTTLYNDHLHARSVSSGHHPSRSWIKQFHSQIKSDIPEGYRICGENLFAKHSIFYNSLPSYFLSFSIWEQNKCLSWDETLDFCELIGIVPVPTLYEGIWDEKKVKECWTGKSKFGEEQEGYVVRLYESFLFDDFDVCLGKFVRKNHVQTSEHWMAQEIFPNLVHNTPNSG